MAWRFHGKASVSTSSPRAFGICDRCGSLYNLITLRFQNEWRGNALQSTGSKVCPRCMDRPQPQLRPRILPPDQIPVIQPRPEPYALDNLGGGAALPVSPATQPHVAPVTLQRPWGFGGAIGEGL